MNGRCIELHVKCGGKGVGVVEKSGGVDRFGGKGVSRFVESPPDREPFGSFAEKGEARERAFDDQRVCRVAESARAIAKPDDGEIVASDSNRGGWEGTCNQCSEFGAPCFRR